MPLPCFDAAPPFFMQRPFRCASFDATSVFPTCRQFIFSILPKQHVFKKLMLKSGGFKLELDHETKLFLSMFSSTPSKNLVWGEGTGSEGGRHILSSQISRTQPPFVRWSGGVAEADVTFHCTFTCTHLSPSHSPLVEPIFKSGLILRNLRNVPWGIQMGS